MPWADYSPSRSLASCGAVAACACIDLSRCWTVCPSDVRPLGTRTWDTVRSGPGDPIPSPGRSPDRTPNILWGDVFVKKVIKKTFLGRYRPLLGKISESIGIEKEPLFTDFSLYSSAILGTFALQKLSKNFFQAGNGHFCAKHKMGHYARKSEYMNKVLKKCRFG